MGEPAKTEYKLWAYDPSVAGGVIGASVFAILTLFHGWRLFRNRTWFCIPFVIGGLVCHMYTTYLMNKNDLLFS
jgi:hypothetical protein